MYKSPCSDSTQIPSKSQLASLTRKRNITIGKSQNKKHKNHNGLADKMKGLTDKLWFSCQARIVQYCLFAISKFTVKFPCIGRKDSGKGIQTFLVSSYEPYICACIYGLWIQPSLTKQNHKLVQLKYTKLNTNVNKIIILQLLVHV